MVRCLNDYCLVELTPIMMKCFERVVKRHIHSLDSMDYRSMDYAISHTRHSILLYLDTKNTYFRMLFVDFISAFNTIISQPLVRKFSLLGLNTPLCTWILYLLTERPQSVCIVSRTSGTITLSKGALKRCMLSPLLFMLLT